MIKDQLVTANKDEIIKADGRRSDGHEAAKKGSFIYLLYNRRKELLYVGETGKSIRNRLVTDGSGAHEVKNPMMFQETEFIAYLKTVGGNKLTENERKLIEQALSLYLSPKWYSNKQT